MKNRLTIHQVFVCIIWIFLQITIAACGNNQCLQSPLNQHRNVSTPFHGPLTVQWSLNPCCQVLHFMVLQHDSLVADLSNPAGNVASLILYQSNYTLIFGMIPHFTIDTYNENQFQINAMFDPYQCYKRNSSEFTSTDDEQILGEEYNLNVTLLFVVNYTSGDGNTTLDYTENSYTTQTYIRMSIFLPIPLLVGFLSLLIRFLRKKEKLRRNRKEHRIVIRRMQSNPTTSEQTPDTLTVPHFTSSIKKQPKETKIEIELNKFENQEMKPKMGQQMLTVPSDAKHAILSRAPNRRLTSSESFNSFHSSRNTTLSADVKVKRRITYPQVICESIALKELSKYVNLLCTPLVESYGNVITKSSACESDCCKSEINQSSSKLNGTFDQNQVMTKDLSVDLVEVHTTFENYTLKNRDIIEENDTPFVVPKTGAIKSLIDNGTMRLYKPNQFLIKPIKPNEARDMEFGFFCKERRKLDERHFTDVDGLLDWPCVESADAKMTLQRMRSNTL